MDDAFENTNINNSYTKVETICYNLKNSFYENKCYCFSSIWTAPEILLKEKKCTDENLQKADIYSFGVILQEMITLNGPFNLLLYQSPCQILLKIIRTAKMHHFQNKMCQNIQYAIEGMQYFISVMELCMRLQPERRPSFLKLKTFIKFSMFKNGVKSNIFDNFMNLMTIYSQNLENLMEEQAGILLKEKKKAQQLLCRMFPKSIVSQLIRGIPIEPELFNQVTVYFSDIVGFTNLCSKLNPFQVLKILDELYTRFDEIVSMYNVFKVETIGDAYMAVSGLPVRKGSRHATEIVEMAINILNTVSSFSFEKLGISMDSDCAIKIRIGIHTGPVAAGIVGIKMPRYCLFGETVTIAQKMEQTGIPKCIHISESTLDLLENKSNYIIEHYKTLEFPQQEIKTFVISGYTDQFALNSQWWKQNGKLSILSEQDSEYTSNNYTSIEINSDIYQNNSINSTSETGDDIFSDVSSLSNK